MKHRNVRENCMCGCGSRMSGEERSSRWWLMVYGNRHFMDRAMGECGSEYVICMNSRSIWITCLANSFRSSLTWRLSALVSSWSTLSILSRSLITLFRLIPFWIIYPCSISSIFLIFGRQICLSMYSWLSLIIPHLFLNRVQPWRIHSSSLALGTHLSSIPAYSSLISWNAILVIIAITFSILTFPVMTLIAPYPQVWFPWILVYVLTWVYQSSSRICCLSYSPELCITVKVLQTLISDVSPGMKVSPLAFVSEDQSVLIVLTQLCSFHTRLDPFAFFFFPFVHMTKLSAFLAYTDHENFIKFIFSRKKVNLQWTVRSAFSELTSLENDFLQEWHQYYFLFNLYDMLHSNYGIRKLLAYFEVFLLVIVDFFSC